MVRSSSEEVKKAVDYVVLAGKTPREAWELVGEPGGEAGIQNIRKQARERKALTSPDAPACSVGRGASSAPRDEPSCLTAPTVAPAGRKNNETAPFRRNSQQVDKQHEADIQLERLYIDALKAATLELQQAQMTGRAGSKGCKVTGESLATKHNVNLPKEAKQLTGQAIRYQVKNGRAGASPLKRGPDKIIPDSVVGIVATHASMCQLNGDEQKPHKIKRNIIALVDNTEFEPHLASHNQRAKFLKRLRQLPLAGGGASLTSVPKMVVDNRRWMWLTYNNVDRYFTGWRYFLLNEGFADDESQVQPDDATAEVTIRDDIKARLSCGDETHQVLSNAGDESGPRGSTYINPKIKRSGSRHVESPTHITSYIFVNGADEVGTYVAIFSSGTSEAEDRKLNIMWTAGLPCVQAKWGHDEVFIHEPVVLLTPKGGISEDALEMIITSALVPLYPPGSISPMWKYDDDGNVVSGPICHRLDGGPGRTGTSSLPMRMRLAEKGIFLFPSGPQNCTAATQEPDQLFGAYKTKCDAVTDIIVAERINARAAAEDKLRSAPDAPRRIDKSMLPKVELTNADLPRVVNGVHGDPIEKRPFSYAFSRECVHAANAKVGAVPLTRAALYNPKVRKELESTEEAGGVVATIVREHQANLAACTAMALNTRAMDVSLPRRFELVAPPSTEDEVILRLKEAGCSQASQWINLGAVAFNSSVVNKAGVAIVKDALDKKSDSATATLASFHESKEAANAIWLGMYDKEIEYEDLSSGERKTLIQFYLRAKGEKGVTAACASVQAQLEFLNGIADETFEELFLLDTPIGYKAVEQVDSVAAKLLTDMSASMAMTLEGQQRSERESVLALTGLAGTVDEEEEPRAGQTIDAAQAGFELPAGTLLYKLPPPEAMLKFASDTGSQLKGYEIIRKFKDWGWCTGRVLNQAADASMKDAKRIANYVVFYEADNSLIYQSLYPNSYACDASSPVGSWMVVAGRSSGPLALQGPRPEPLYLMP